MNYEQAKAKANQLWSAAIRASHELAIARGTEVGPMGLTPDHVKACKAYRLAKNRFDYAAAELAQFNATYTKAFKREIAADRARRTK